MKKNRTQSREDAKKDLSFGSLQEKISAPLRLSGEKNIV